MAGEIIASAILQMVSKKLASGMMKELGHLWGVQRDLESLASTLSTIQDVLDDAEGRPVKDKALRGWLEELRDAAYDADDLLNEFEMEAQLRRVEHHAAQRLRRFFSHSNGILFRLRMVNKTREIRKRFDAIAAKRLKFHLETRDGMGWRAETGERMTVSAVTESEIYGRDDDRKNIMKLLKSDGVEDIGVIPIVGMGGLGKTTLAQLAFKDAKDYFDLRIWVYVSMDFDVKRVTAAALESATGAPCDLSELEPMGHRLQQKLAGKKFLLVFDDVWEENPDRWEQVKAFLRDGTKGSKIIVTTRSEKVASIMGTTTPYHLGILSEDHCWMLFRRRAFEMGGRRESPNLVNIGKEIVKKCGGVPLAAKALGGLMRFKWEESEWLAVKNSEIWSLSKEEENEILPSLRLSYYHLSPRRRKCFAYCALFPKGGTIVKHELITQWVAQGFIPSSDGSTPMDDVGNRYFNDLLWLSLLEDPEEHRDGRTVTCKMHDLAYDLARSVAGDEVGIIKDEKVSITEQCRYASLIDCTDTSAVPAYFLKKVRALQVRGWHTSPGLMCNIFPMTKCLRVLSCEDGSVSELPSSIKKLKNLRYLSLTSRRVGPCLPVSIGSLYNLQTLVLKGGLDILPESIGGLQNLQRLSLDSYALRSLPESLGTLPNLQVLIVCAPLDMLPKSFGKLTNLQSLNLSGGMVKALPESIGGLHKLRVCSIKSFQHLKTVPDSICNLVELELLDLHNCIRLSRLPEGIGDLRSLRHLYLDCCILLRGMPLGIGRLVNLQTLDWYVVGPKDERFAGIDEIELLNLIGGGLSIRGLENVTNSKVAKCANVKGKQHLRSLDLSWTFQPDYDAEHATAVLEGLLPHPNLEELSINDFNGASLPSWMMRLEEFLPNLVSIELQNLKRCVRLPPLGQLPSLKVLEIFGMSAVVQIGRGFYGTGAGPFFPRLQKLRLMGMLNLKAWNTVMMTNDGHGIRQCELFPCLVEVIIHSCPKLIARPSFPPSVRVQYS